MRPTHLGGVGSKQKARIAHRTWNCWLVVHQGHLAAPPIVGYGLWYPLGMLRSYSWVAIKYEGREESAFVL